MQILYRISSNSYEKARLSSATKENCLDNFIDNVVTERDEMTIIADNVDRQLMEFIKSRTRKNINVSEHNLGSNGASFRLQLDLAASFADQEIILLQEDDYLYKPAEWPYQEKTTYNELLEEALEKSDYASLYDHPDKYMAPAVGGNKYISDDGTENTGIFLTSHSHWKYTNSTTCTFASKSKTIRSDMKIWKQFCQGDHPYDFQAFIALSLKGRKLASPIPGKATHCDSKFISPFFVD